MGWIGSDLSKAQIQEKKKLDQISSMLENSAFTARTLLHGCTTLQPSSLNPSHDAEKIMSGWHKDVRTEKGDTAQGWREAAGMTTREKRRAQGRERLRQHGDDGEEPATVRVK
ncbi:hypothetical protein PIB30_085573 [Stylosanthes scabra]|uniref:Uncharacterized protein n=1 Tax=Stylosanthes scabra TaxID=79078 RepID=A0ABU6WSS4_9FABA|nr:hypothetical protein [Stylosanthes scabra]